MGVCVWVVVGGVVCCVLCKGVCIRVYGSVSVVCCVCFLIIHVSVRFDSFLLVQKMLYRLTYFTRIISAPYALLAVSKVDLDCMNPDRIQICVLCGAPLRFITRNNGNSWIQENVSLV